MKRSNYFLIAALCSFNMAAYSQTIPFGFKNAKSKMFNDVPDRIIQKDFIKEDGTIEHKKIDVKTDYSTISEDLQDTADSLRRDANQKFSDGIGLLGKPKNVGQLRAYEINLETLEDQRELVA